MQTESGNRHVRIFSSPDPSKIQSQQIYLSPFLIYNIGSPKTVRISKITDQTVQPAKEVTISRLASAITTDRALQTAFLSGLRTYFETYNRIVRNGDVIAVPIDTILAKSMYAPGEEVEEGSLPLGRPNETAWFKITALVGEGEEMLIEPNQTRMIQSGIVKDSCVPTTLPWKQYLGLPGQPSYITGTGNFLYAAKLEQYLTASISSLGATLQTTILLSSSKRGAGKTTLLHSIAAKLGIHVLEISCYTILGDTDTKTLGTLRARLERATSISPCVVLLRHVDAIAGKTESDGKDAGMTASVVDMISEFAGTDGLIVCATVADVDKLSESVRARFKFEVEVGVPSEPERKEIFRQLTHDRLERETAARVLGKQRLEFGYALRPDVGVDTLALQSAGLTPPDLVSIVKTARQKALVRFEKYVKSHSDLNIRDLVLSSGGIVKLSPEDFEDAISEARQKYSDSIGAPRIPNVSWEDVGGLEGVKKEILDTIEMPLKYPHLFSSGMKKRSGILFYGPPGTGKTLLAKAIATTFSLNFFSVKGPELLNMYIGESEANVRKVFQKARDARPCVVFFDELDSVAPKRGNQGDSGGVMDRIVSQLLAELDGMSGSGGEGVFVVGATNRPDLLDEALLRPGRFDKMLYLGISETDEMQKTILEALTRKFVLAPGVSLDAIAHKCPFTYTGADFYALCSDAMLNAMTRTTNEVDSKIAEYNEALLAANPSAKKVSVRWWFENVATDADTDVLVTEGDFDKAVNELIPSVSAEELKHYLRVRENFQGGKAKAKGNAGTPAAVTSEVPVSSATAINNGADNDGSLPMFDYSNPEDKRRIEELVPEFAQTYINGVSSSEAEVFGSTVAGPVEASLPEPSKSTPAVEPASSDSLDAVSNGSAIINGSGDDHKPMSGNGNGNGNGNVNGGKPKRNKGKGVSRR